jgi:hypothetical protein
MTQWTCSIGAVTTDRKKPPKKIKVGVKAQHTATFSTTNQGYKFTYKTSQVG